MNIEELVKKIRAGALVCTSNQRLARHILARYDRLMLDEGLKSWKTPAVNELKGWLASFLIEQGGVFSGRSLITRTMALALWEEVLSKDLELSSVAPTISSYRNSLISLSFDAYSILKEHRAELPSKNFYLNDEAAALKRWSAGYERLLVEKGFLCPSGLLLIVAELIEKGEVEVAGELVLAGFEEISPALVSLIDALKDIGVKVSFWPDGSLLETLDDTVDIERLVKGVELFAFSDMREEIVEAARWARENATQGKKTGIIAINLAQYKELIEREFASELSPASALLDGAGSISETFNLSMAAPLSKSPIVKAALDLLSITEATRPLETELIWEIFNSPYFHASGEEYFSLAAMDARLRRFNRSELTLYGFLKELSKDEGDSLKGFTDKVGLLIETLEPKDKKLLKGTPSVWAGRFFADLKEFGWPGSMDELTSREFQAYEAFNAIFSEFAALDDIKGPLKRGEAVGALRRMAEKSTHQPKSPETLIEVIGISESIGFDFDAIRIIGLSSEAFPPAIDPNPFIPIAMQRELKLVRAVPELESMRAKLRLMRVIKGAGKVVASYPEMIDNKETRVSPFFSTLSLEEDEEQRESKCFKETVQASSLLEDMEQDPVVGFMPNEVESLGGGTSILKDQSACPFKAFATYRLGARVVESPEPGLSYAERGNLVHSTLKIFWEEVGSSEALDRLIREDRLAAELRLSVDKALSPYTKSLREVNYLNLEKKRLERLLSAWLLFESSREPFAVETLEIEDNREISGLNIKFRVDRVDSVPTLGHVVMDYKTGACSRKDWLGTRPKDPQMLIYNLFGPYEALAFARVKPGECKFEGVASSPGMLPGNKGFDNETRFRNSLAADGIDSFDVLTDSWVEVVEKLASDFVEGLSAVDPNGWAGGNEQLACYYSHCALKPLCRIFEAEDSPGDSIGESHDE